MRDELVLSSGDRDVGDSSLVLLLELDGEVVALNEGYWVKFTIHRVPRDLNRPNGIGYSLTLHRPDGTRILGYDNAHGVGITRGPAPRRRKAHDHRHRYETVRPYEYRDAATLLEDFWRDVAGVLAEEGIE